MLFSLEHKEIDISLLELVSVVLVFLKVRPSVRLVHCEVLFPVNQVSTLNQLPAFWVKYCMSASSDFDMCDWLLFGDLKFTHSLRLRVLEIIHIA